MKNDIKIFLETTVAPTTQSFGDVSLCSDSFPNLKKLLENGYLIKHIKISLFDYAYSDEIVPQLNVFAILEKSIV